MKTPLYETERIKRQYIMNTYRKPPYPTWKHYLAAIMAGVVVTTWAVYFVINHQPQ